MRASLADLLNSRTALVCDGATGTNYMGMGLGPGDPPELWNVEHTDRVTTLYQQFVDAGADVILTNTFGGNASRLALHHHQDRVHELNEASAKLARAVADACERPVVVAGSVGPTGALFEPLGPMTPPEATAMFRAQMEGLRDGGADVIWIETMSAQEEMLAAAQAAIEVGMPYTVTGSFDTAGRTMMGIHPATLHSVFCDVAHQPLATGANCGVGASDILVTVLNMESQENVVISKGNCGIPQVRGSEVVYSGSPELMERYGRLAVHAGARIVGGCCGTSPEHLAAIRRGVDAAIAELAAGERLELTLDMIVSEIGLLSHTPPSANTPQAGAGEGRRGRRRG
jgi:5-methyltetrahydrofolate--homocysteine methyltransferase